MTKTHILGTGLHGLIGTQVTDLLQDSYQFTNISRSSGVDITDLDQVLTVVTASDAPYLLHLAAKADVDGCEQDKSLGEEGEAWRINVLGTKNLAEACAKTGKLMLYISTDFVFDGEKDESFSGYTEQDTPAPVNWYGYTKYQGEEVIKQSEIHYLILRPAYPYGQPYATKKDFVRAIMARFQAGLEVRALTDHIFTPTIIADLASALDRLISGGYKNETYHIVGSQSLTPYVAANLIAKQFGYDHSLIHPTTRAEFFKDRAKRPFNLSLRNDRISKLGVSMKRFEDGLKELTV